MKVKSSLAPSPWVVCVYGVPGVGKSTLGSFAPDPIFLDVEGGIDRIECSKYQADDWPEERTQIKTYDELINAFREVYESKFSTVVIDTASAVEEILTARILNDAGKTNLSEMPYGQGFEALKAAWALITKIMFDLKSTGKNVLLIAHDSIEKVENPSGENYDRYGIAVHKKSAPLVIGKMDGVFFAHYERNVVTTSSDKKVAVDTGNRFLLTIEKPFAVAKNRFKLEELVPFNTPNDVRSFFERLK